MLNNLEVLRIDKKIGMVLKNEPNEMVISMPCSPEECLVIEYTNGYREGKCPKCGARIYAHGYITGHDRW